MHLNRNSHDLMKENDTVKFDTIIVMHENCRVLKGKRYNLIFAMS